MKLATRNDGTPDGELLVVSRDLGLAVSAKHVVGTLQEALEQWDAVATELASLSSALDAGGLPNSGPFELSRAAAPLPRAWQWLDASAYESHGQLMDKAFKREPLPRDRPLMYQGLSHRFYSATADVALPSEADGIDFEGEFGIITDAVPMGIAPGDALPHIKLIVLINDWSLRRLAPIEMKTGFGWIQAKPACSMSPVAITADELGGAWRDGRVGLRLDVAWNGQIFGTADGYPMAQGFHELIAHAAYSRDLVAGTVLGSGTVSNENFREIGSSCIAERRGIEIVDYGEAKTAYMRFGDRVRMEARLDDGTSAFGAIDQCVVRAAARATRE